MADDHLAVIAESYRANAETQQILAQTQRQIAQTQQLGFRLQGFALALLGVSLLFTGYVVWQHLAQRDEHAALQQALRTQTQDAGRSDPGAPGDAQTGPAVRRQHAITPLYTPAATAA